MLSAQGVLTCPGDVNLDGQQGPGDLGVLSQHLSGEQILEGEALANADVNSDSVVDVGDLIRLTQHTTGEFPLIPCGNFDPEEIECPEVVLGQDSAQPLERVSIGVLPEDLVEPVVAVVADVADELAILTIVEANEDGSSTLITPFYPGPSIEGGQVRVLLTNGMHSCPLMDFVIEAIPPAPGELSRLVDGIQQLVGVEASLFEVTTAELLDAGLPSTLIPLGVTQVFVDDPENLDSLRAMSEGTAPLFEGASDNTQLDAIVAHLQLMELLEADFGVSSSNGQPLDEGAAGLPKSTSPQQLALFSCGESAENLDVCMRTSIEADKELNPTDGPATAKIKEDVALSIAALKFFPATRAIVEVPEQVIDDTKKLFPAIDVALTVQKWANEAAAGLLPSNFFFMDFNLFPQSMEEDLESGEWGVSSLIAVSKGWKLDGRRVLQYAFERLGAKKILKDKTKKAIGKMFEIGRQLSTPELLELEGELVDLIVDNVLKVAPNALKGTTVFEIPPRLFGPVDIDDEDWSEATVKGNTVNLVTHNEYEPREVGPSDIVVEVRTDGGRFGGVPPIGRSKRVNVSEIILDVTPDLKVLEEGERIVFFDVHVANSVAPENVEAIAKIGEAEIEYQGEAQHLLTYEAPDPVPVDFVDLVTVRHTGETGARRPSLNPPERNDVTEVRGNTRQINVTPKAECVDPEKTLQFMAEVLGLENQEVSWAASHGDISDSGLFMAPESPVTMVTITATSVTDSELTGRATLKVGGCECFWIVTVGASEVTGIPGEAYGSFFRNTATGEVLIGLSTGEESSSILFDPVEQSWSGGGNIGVPSGTAYDDILGTLFGELVQNSETAVDGFVSGLVEVTELLDGETVEHIEPFSARFRVEEDPEHALFFLPHKGCFVEAEE